VLKFARRNIVPPGGIYFYETPETKQRFEHPQFSHLELLVREHYYNNNVETPEMLPALMEDYMCRHLPESFCTGRTDGEVRRAKTLTYWVVSDNTFRILPRPGTAEGFVDAQEAERRAGICSRCGNNLSGICSSCSGLKLRFAAQMRGLSTTHDRFLGVCAVDGCLLTAKVFSPLILATQVMNRERTYEYEGIKVNPECWVPEDKGLQK
jgi:hypothetical protein